MKPVELKVARIGNSRGVRLLAPTLERYRIGATVVMEERSDGILLRPPGSVSPKLSWEETAACDPRAQRLTRLVNLPRFRPCPPSAWSARP